MRSENDEKQCINCIQQELLDKVVGFNDWATNAPEIKKTLTTMLLTYLCSERVEEDSQEGRELIAFHVYMINNLLDDLYNFEINNLKNKAA